MAGYLCIFTCCVDVDIFIIYKSIFREIIHYAILRH